MITRNFLAMTTIATSIALIGCASNPAAVREAGSVPVRYTTSLPDGSVLKERPSEVTIVRKANTQKEVGKQVALNVLMLALGGGAGLQTFGKGDLRGGVIELAGDRANIKNPIPDEFVTRLNERINGAIRADAVLSQKVWENPIEVAGGHTRLLYETLLGEEEKFRLSMSLVVYKRKENWSSFSLQRPNVEVGCEMASDKPLPLPAWSDNQYSLVKTELTAMLDKCEKDVVAAMPGLLKQ